jgi:hypothetical protein
MVQGHVVLTLSQVKITQLIMGRSHTAIITGGSVEFE